MAKLIFYPIGNADTTIIHLPDGRMVLFDYCNMPLEATDKRINLQDEIQDYLALHNKESFDMVAFTHADDDHVHGAEDLFWFNYAQKYQGEGRVKVETLAIPACFLLEAGLTGSARVIRDEARFRLKNGTGIIIFGDPDLLRDWMEEENISPTTRTNCIVNAGELVPGFDHYQGQVEFFVHSPFSFKMEDEEVPRNGNCLIMHATFFEGNEEMRLMLGGDGTYDDWQNIIYITKKAGNDIRLQWDVFHISHHCSYRALSDEKGKDKTIPVPVVDELYHLAGKNCVLVSPSDPIPSVDTDQPPHRQAAAYYKDIAQEYGYKDNFVVTMEWPSKDRPRPIIIESTRNGFVVHKRVTGGAVAVLEKPSPRLG